MVLIFCGILYSQTLSVSILGSRDASLSLGSLTHLWPLFQLPLQASCPGLSLAINIKIWVVLISENYQY